MSRRFSIRARLQSFRFAFCGLVVLLKTQQNSWIHLFATVAVIGSGILLRVTNDQWCLLIVAIALVWITEAVNTAIEFLADVASPDFHPTIGKCKDVAAAAVLLAAIAAALIGAFVFVPKLLT